MSEHNLKNLRCEQCNVFKVSQFLILCMKTLHLIFSLLYWINQFHTTGLFQHPLKISENERFPDVLRGQTQCKPPLGGGALQKLSHLWGYQKSCQKGGITLKRSGVDVEMGGCHFFITLQFNCMYCVCVCVCGGEGGGGEGWESKVSSITFWFFSLLSQPCKILIQAFIVLKHCIIYIFLIHLQRISTALFKLVWNTQKRTCTIFFKYQGKMFLNL